MKKILFAIVVSLFSLAFAEVPDFPEQPDAVIKDISEVTNSKRLKDRIRLISYSEKENLKIKLYFYDESNKKWIVYGIGKLNEYSDTDFVDSQYEDKLKIVKYLALCAPENSTLEYSYKEYHHDLYIYVNDK